MHLWPPAEWPDPIRRGLRTFGQAFVGSLFIAFVVAPVLAPGETPSLATLQKVLVAAGWAGVIAVISWLHNALEDSAGVPLKPLLKRPSLEQMEQGR